MLNFRKLKHDFPASILKEGKALYDKGVVVSVKIVKLTNDVVRLSCQVVGSFEFTRNSAARACSDELVYCVRCVRAQDVH